MKKKRKLRKSVRRITLVLVMILMLSIVCRQINKSIMEKIVTVSHLKSLANENTKIQKIIENKDNYPKTLLEMLSKNSDMADYVLNYPEFKGRIFSNNIGDVTKGIYPLLLQYDTRWGYGMYGDDVIAINGCGPTSLAMIIAGLTGRNDITPYDIATYSYQNGYYDNGTSWLLFTKGVKYYGIVGTEIPLSKLSMMNELERGHPIICSMRKGDFTTTGHIIAIVGIEDGKFVIHDPNSRDRSNMLWSYERIENQIKNLWSFKLI